MDNGFIELANAVVMQAAQDYQQALCELEKKRQEVKALEGEIYELESFFEGEEILVYTKLDGPTLEHRLKQEVIDCNYIYKRVRNLHSKS